MFRGNPEAALSEEPRPGADRKLSGMEGELVRLTEHDNISREKEEALLVATACSNPPEGRARWTLELFTVMRYSS